MRPRPDIQRGIASRFRFFHACSLFGGILVALSLGFAIWVAYHPPGPCGPPGEAIPTDCTIGDVVLPSCGLLLGGLFLMLGLFGVVVERARITGHRPGG